MPRSHRGCRNRAPLVASRFRCRAHPRTQRAYYSSSLGGTALSWTIDFYAATPNLGVTLTQLTVNGINITTQIVSRLPAATGQSGVSIDFIVDRVYSCIGPGGGLMVIEGHR